MEWTVAIGVDTHKEVHVAVALDALGAQLDSREIATTAAGYRCRERGRDTFTIVERDPLAAEAGSNWSIAIGRGDWQTRVETESRMTGDSDAFRVTNALEAYEGNTRVSANAWQFSVPRDLV